VMSNIGFYLSGVIAAGIIFIGCRFLLAPSTAATAYGVPAGAEPHSQAYLSAKSRSKKLGFKSKELGWSVVGA
jgi:hypothetical protein